jgi:acylaminoacyl-peptidase
MARPGYEADRRRVVMLDWPAGAARVLTESWDRSADSLAWSADSRRLVTTAANVGTTSLFAIDAATGAVTALVDRHTNGSPRPLPDGRILFTQNSLASPVELYAVTSTGGQPQRVTNLNGERLATLAFGASSQFSFTGAHGDTVYGYLIEPVGFDPAQRYPLAFLSTGAPGPSTTPGTTAGTHRFTPPTDTPRCRSTFTVRPATARPSPMPSTATGAVRHSRT